MLCLKKEKACAQTLLGFNTHLIFYSGWGNGNKQACDSAVKLQFSAPTHSAQPLTSLLSKNSYGDSQTCR